MNSEFLNGHLFPREEQWIHIAPYGRHPHQEGMQVFHQEDAEKCIRLFHRDVLIDAEHQSLKWSEAYGWVKRLEARDDGLWGQVEWTDLGEQAVGTGRFRFTSVVWNGRWDSEGNFRPTAIEFVTLTNFPNLKGLQPISTTRKGVTLLVAALQREHARALKLAHLLTQLYGWYLSLEEDLADSDLARFSDVISPDERPEWREALLKNREEAISLLKRARNPQGRSR